MGLVDEWRFCPRCRDELERGAGRVECPACAFVAYANSAPTASALVADARGRVLLARRAVEPFAGLWDIPGGFLAEHEHPEDGVRRELREETGLEIEPETLLGIWMDWYGRGPGVPATLNLVWSARALGGDPVAADDVSELAWFDPAELPSGDELAFRWLGEALAAWKQETQRARVAPEP
jgi:8-oxo-dGTP diphosphatase